MEHIKGNIVGGSGAVVAELEGTLLRDTDLFPYLALVSFEASWLGLLRFALLVLVWPVVWALQFLGMGWLGLDIMIFLAVAGVRTSEVEAVARAVLPKFFVDDVCMSTWNAFARVSSNRRRVVVTRCPRLLVDRFAKEHLEADAVVHGGELEVNRFGYATGFVRRPEGTVVDRVKEALAGEKPILGLGRSADGYFQSGAFKDEYSTFLCLCKEQRYPPHDMADNDGVTVPPRPVVFHDGRLVRRPTPLTALLILLYLPLGFVLAIARIVMGLLLPNRLIPYFCCIYGDGPVVKGRVPPAPEDVTNGGSGGVLYVCTHRSVMDAVVLANVVLGRRVPAVTYSISRLTEILSPIPTIRLSRDRATDAMRIKQALSKGELILFPEGTTGREPFLLRFSALFAELTDRIVPVAIDYRVGLFHATASRGWKAFDFLFFFMNPRPFYAVTFLNQLPREATCSGGRSRYEVANYVQRILAASLRFQCTDFTRKDKYRLLVGTDGSVDASLRRPRRPVSAAVKSQLGSFLGLLGFNRALTTSKLAT